MTADRHQTVDFEVVDTVSSENPVILSDALQVSASNRHDECNNEAPDELISDNEIQANDVVSLSADINDAHK